MINVPKLRHSKPRAVDITTGQTQKSPDISLATSSPAHTINSRAGTQEPCCRFQCCPSEATPCNVVVCLVHQSDLPAFSAMQARQCWRHAQTSEERYKLSAPLQQQSDVQPQEAGWGGGKRPLAAGRLGMSTIASGTRVLDAHAKTAPLKTTVAPDSWQRAATTTAKARLGEAGRLAACVALSHAQDNQPRKQLPNAQPQALATAALHGGSRCGRFVQDTPPTLPRGGPTGWSYVWCGCKWWGAPGAAGTDDSMAGRRPQLAGLLSCGCGQGRLFMRVAGCIIAAC